MNVVSQPAPLSRSRVHSSVIARQHGVEGRLVYAIGDVHGRYDLLLDLLQRVAVDARERGKGRRPVLILCGDYVDRGTDSARVIESLCWLQRHCSYECHFLRGNHEQVFVDFLANPAAASDWLRFGGAETLSSYGVLPPAADAPLPEIIRARDDLLEVLPIAHQRFLEGLVSLLTLGDYAFVHAGVRPGVPLEEQREADLLWIRKAFLDHDIPGKVVVHGHTWRVTDPDIRPFRIGIDTGAYQTGVLTAICIEDGSIRFLRKKSFE